MHSTVMSEFILISYLRYISVKRVKILNYLSLINGPGVAGAVLQTPLLLIKCVSDSWFVKIFATPQWLEIVLSVTKEIF